MSDSDQEYSLLPGWLELESDLPWNSSVDSTLELGINVSSFSANQTQTRAVVHGDSNIAGPASNRGTSVGYVPLEGTRPDKVEEFLESPTQTTARSKSPTHLSCHRSWAMGRGRGLRRERAKNSTVGLTVW